MGGLGLNGIKFPMEIEKIKILGVVLEQLARQHNQILNRSLSHIMNLQLETVKIGKDNKNRYKDLINN